MEIRRLRKTDLQNFFECRLRALKSSPSAFLISYDEEKTKGADHFLKSLEHDGNERAIFGAFAGGEIIGTLGIYREDHSRINHKATIWGVHVDAGFRGQGVGRKLLKRALGFAKDEMGVLSVALSVESKNTPAQKLYASQGFKTWGTEPKAMRHEDLLLDEDHMIRFL